MKFQQPILTFVLLLSLTSCRFNHDQQSERIISPSKHYYLITSVNRTNNKNDDFADVVIHLYNSNGKLESKLNTNAGDANKWSVGWHKTQDTIILFSSDIGNSAWSIETGQMKSIEFTESLKVRADEIKREKYKE